MTGFDVRRKRPWWVGWIPAAVLLLLIIGVAVTVVAIQGTSLGKPLPKPTLGQVTELNWSSFGQEGLDYIERSRNVRIDFSRPPIAADSLGLPAEGSTTVGPSFNDDTDNDYYLIVNGGGEGYGGTKLTVSELTVRTEGGLVTGLVATASGAMPFRDALNLMLGDVEEFGWAEPDTTALFASVKESTTAGEPYEFTFGPGNRLGFEIAATAKCEPTGFCVVEYDVAPTVR